jgi:hypothetical protein
LEPPSGKVGIAGGVGLASSCGRFLTWFPTSKASSLGIFLPGVGEVDMLSVLKTRHAE